MLYNAKDDQGRLVFENIVQLAKKWIQRFCVKVLKQWNKKNAVKAAGCEIMQGFYFYKPMTEFVFENLIENNWLNMVVVKKSNIF